MLETQIVATFEENVRNFLQEQSDRNLSSYLSVHFLLLSILEPSVKIILALHCDHCQQTHSDSTLCKTIEKGQS
jgi:hypothetical protein